MILVNVFDLKAQAHLNIATLRTKGEAIRQFEEICKTSDSMFAKHPSDFVLKKVAEYDEVSGIVTPVEHEVLATASEFIH